MGDYYRSKSYADGRMEMEIFYGENGSNNNNNGIIEKPTNLTSSNSSNNGGFQEFRCYSASHATTNTQEIPRELKKGKSVNNASSSKAGWCFSDPEMQRKKRVASYKSYSVEGKIKRSFSKSFRWIKGRYSNMVQGW
ncbi:hypothetical protein SOVF_081590 [Spinacia oleracea]|uniref:DUF3511 domain-containing protein n=1 Tax=Spinacia oleracea TaxID=3562 RepID=A0A9R0J258_SPIOL|nr:uncharacterized protein LOC110797724 [Spinacia oleracea]KNA17264.1 hypothetical protein SOVF_081590 [Spinacia oleracea]